MIKVRAGHFSPLSSLWQWTKGSWFGVSAIAIRIECGLEILYTISQRLAMTFFISFSPKFINWSLKLIPKKKNRFDTISSFYIYLFDHSCRTKQNISIEGSISYANHKSSSSHWFVLSKQWSSLREVCRCARTMQYPWFRAFVFEKSDFSNIPLGRSI